MATPEDDVIIILLNDVFGDSTTPASKLLDGLNERMGVEQSRLVLSNFMGQLGERFIARGGRIMQVPVDPKAGFYEELMIKGDTMHLISTRDKTDGFSGLSRVITMLPEEDARGGGRLEMSAEIGVKSTDPEIVDPSLKLVMATNPDQDRSTRCITVSMEAFPFGNTQQMMAHYDAHGVLTSFGIPRDSLEREYQEMLKDPEKDIRLLPYAWIFLDQGLQALRLYRYRDEGIFDMEDGGEPIDKSRLHPSDGLNINVLIDGLPVSFKANNDLFAARLGEENDKEAMHLLLPRRIDAIGMRRLFDDRVGRWMQLENHFRFNLRIPVIGINYQGIRAANR